MNVCSARHYLKYHRWDERQSVLTFPILWKLWLLCLQFIFIQKLGSILSWSSAALRVCDASQESLYGRLQTNYTWEYSVSIAVKSISSWEIMQQSTRVQYTNLKMLSISLVWNGFALVAHCSKILQQRCKYGIIVILNCSFSIIVVVWIRESKNGLLHSSTWRFQPWNLHLIFKLNLVIWSTHVGK